MPRASEGIKKLGDRLYQVTIELGQDANGKRQRHSERKHGSLQDAKKLRDKLREDKKRGAYVGCSSQRLADWLRSWVESKRDSVSSRTYERYVSLLESSVIPELGGHTLEKLMPQHLTEYYTKCLKEPGRSKGSTLSPTTIRHRHVVLKMALKAAHDQGITSRNAAAHVKPPAAASVKSMKSRLRCLDAAEASRFLVATQGSADLLPVFIGLNTGARLGEILALRWSDLDLDNGRMVIRQTLVEPLKRGDAATWYSFKLPKSGEERGVDLDARTVDALKKHRTAQAAERLRCGVGWAGLDLVVTGLGGLPCRPSTLSTRFHAFVAKMNRCAPCEGSGEFGGYQCAACEGSGSTHEFDGLRFHDLRHSHASIMLASGIPVLTVSQRLGHSTVAFTLDRYGHVLPGQQMAAAEAFAAAVSGT